MSKLTDWVKARVADFKDYYQREPSRVNGWVITLLAAVGVPVAVAGVPVATVVAITLGGLLGTEGWRQTVYAPATVQAIAAEAAAAAKPKRRKTKRRAAP